MSKDEAHPCVCPDPVKELLQLGLRYLDSIGWSEERKLGARYLYDFIIQPSETWCAYIDTTDRQEKL